MQVKRPSVFSFKIFLSSILSGSLHFPYVDTCDGDSVSSAVTTTCMSACTVDILLICKPVLELVLGEKLVDSSILHWWRERTGWMCKANGEKMGEWVLLVWQRGCGEAKQNEE